MTDTAFDDEPPTDGAPDPLRPAFEAVTAALDDYALPAALAAELDAAKRDLVLAVMSNPEPLDQLRAVKTCAKRMAVPTFHSGVPWQIIRDRLFEQAENSGLVAELGELTIATALDAGIHDFSEPAAANGHAVELDAPREEEEPPPIKEIPSSADGHREIVPPPPLPAELVTPLQWPEEPPPRVSWVANNLIPCGDVSSLGGDGGSGKTMAALQLSTALARGAQDWLGHVIEPGPVVFLSGEEPQDEIRRRVARIATRQGFDISDLADLHFWFPSDFADCTLATPGNGGVMQATPLMRSITAAIEQVRPVLVVLDNVAAVFTGNQNDRVMVRTFVNLWRGVARATGAGVLLLDHPSLSGLTNGTGRGGNMDWRNAVRAALHLKAVEDREEAARGVRILECVKNNYAPLGTPTKLEWVDGVLAPEGTASPHQRRAAEADAETRFLELLTKTNALGRDVRETPGRNYAPAMFAEMEPPGGYTKAAFGKAMHRLFRDGRLALESFGPSSKGKKRMVAATGQASP